MKTASIASIMILFICIGAPCRETDTPASCLKRARDFRIARMREAGRNLNAELNRQILQEKTQRAKECAAGFSIDSVSQADAQALIELYGEAGQPEQAQNALEKALSAPGLGIVAQAGLLLSAVNTTMGMTDFTGREAQAEAYMARLDALPGEALAQKVQAHGRMNSYYRALDIDRGIIEHSNKLIDLTHQIKVEEQKSYATQLTAAYVNLAEALAGQGQTDSALEALRRAPLELRGVERIEERIRPVLQRYRLVGKAAEPIEARTWLNAGPGTTRLEPKGSVTLLQFTAHWCGPCRKSYPRIAALQKRYGERGLRVVMATRLYGYFQSRQGLSADEEIAADREYFSEHLGKEIQVAVADPPAAPAGRSGEEADHNEARYLVGGIPQIHVIDRRGIHRLIMVGYDPANEAGLSALIERLLAEAD